MLPVRNDAWMIPESRLNEYEEFSTFAHPDREGILKWLQFTYNKDSPLIDRCEDVKSRSVAAYSASGLEINSSYSGYMLDIGTSQLVFIENIPVGDTEFYMQLDNIVSCFLARVQNNNKFEMLITFQTLYWEYTRRLRSPISLTLDEDKALKSMDIKTKITEPCFELIKKIEQLKLDVFGDNKRISEVAEEKVRKKVSPETWAQKAKVG
jgi:hypothetical protein